MAGFPYYSWSVHKAIRGVHQAMRALDDLIDVSVFTEKRKLVLNLF
jgi:hypothetical protein